MQRPANLLVYYGWLNAYESGECGWNNEKVAISLAKYDLLVLGDGLANPNHGDFANTEIILARIMELNPCTLIFGYVTVAQKLSAFEKKTNQWDALGVHGIFMDEAGYDYGKNRAEFNSRVDYIHSREHSSTCFANAWDIDHILGTDNSYNFPNSSFNPGLLSSNLDITDWYLLESFAVNTESFASGYTTRDAVVARGEKTVLFDIQIASVGIVANDSVDAQKMANFNYCVGLAYGLNAVGVSDTDYGASSAKSKFFDRPKHRGIVITEDVPSVVTVETVALMRFVDQSRIKIDFTKGKESSSIEQY